MDQEIFSRGKEVDIKMKTAKFASKLSYKSKRKITQMPKSKMPIGNKLKSKGKPFFALNFSK